ncbi:MAG: hypothetical protein ACE5G2_05270 [Candidatus Krumholzibacteriia bacterium]
MRRRRTNLSNRAARPGLAALERGLLTSMGFLLCTALACAPRPYRFRNAAPVHRLADTRPIPVPRSRGYDLAFDVYDSVVRQPMVGALEVSRIPAAGDVNSLDEVPESTWYTRRLGSRNVSPEELLRGPGEFGPPQLPLHVEKVKSSGNPGFIVSDARGKRYLVKFDPPEFPGIETSTALVVGRLFWGFGYNVPEDDLVFVRREDLRAGAGRADAAAIDAVLSKVAAPIDGLYRVTASRLIDGIVLGPIPARDVREDDPNDRIPHEDRRALRALRVFGAFVNHTDMRMDNSLDVYVGERGQGHVVHYLIDFGEAFGGHGAEHDRLWDGYNHLFSFGEVAANLVTAGLRVQSWENLGYTPWKSVGAFESRIFSPGDWRESTPYAPIRRSQPADDYWAAKILGALGREHITTLVRAADYPEVGAGEYIIDVLLERRRKLLDYVLRRVSPLEFVELVDGELHLVDVSWKLADHRQAPTRYTVRVFDGGGREIEPPRVLAGHAGDLVVATEHLAGRMGRDYVRVDVTAWWDDRKAPSPAEFQFRPGQGEAPVLVGVVH